MENRRITHNCSICSQAIICGLAILAAIATSAMAAPPVSFADGSVLAPEPAYEELYYDQALDHFDPTAGATWSHRYLLRAQTWDGRGQRGACRGPILVYAGNEGPIEAFWGGNGFMIDVLAPRLGALVVFPEQRFYGTQRSAPSSYCPEQRFYDA